jgi:hypothetical protein
MHPTQIFLHSFFTAQQIAMHKWILKRVLYMETDTANAGVQYVIKACYNHKIFCALSKLLQRNLWYIFTVLQDSVIGTQDMAPLSFVA